MPQKCQRTKSAKVYAFSRRVKLCLKKIVLSTVRDFLKSASGRWFIHVSICGGKLSLGVLSARVFQGGALNTVYVLH